MKKHISAFSVCILTTLASVLTCTRSFAQTVEPAKPVKTGNEWKMPADVFKRSQLFADSLKKVLNLDAPTCQKLRDAYLANTKPMDEIRMGPDSDEEKKEKMKANHQAFNGVLKGILTPEQFNEYLRRDKKFNKP